MLTRVREVIVSSATRAWLATSSNSWRRLPRPVDEPHVHAPGDDPHRLLVLGNGIVMSWGVLSHQIGVGGHLARQLSERTNRGSDVDLVVDVELDVRAARAALADVRPERFDVILLSLGGAEAVRLVPEVTWRRDLDALLDALVAQTSEGTQMFLVGIPPLGRIVRMPRFAERLVVRRMHELTEQAKLACAVHERTTFLTFEPRGTDLVRTRERSTYSEWGSLIATAIAENLNSTTDRERAVECVDEQERLHALESLGILDTPDDVRFDQITETAKALFGVESASINFIDGARQWVKAVSGGRREDVARSDAFCDVTVQRPGVFVVNDALANPRFRDLTMVRAGRVRFYAGYPIESANGMRVGALCLLDPTPRAFSREDEALLRELALRVEAVLRQSAVA